MTRRRAARTGRCSPAPCESVRRVAIIGGGIAGLATALQLRDRAARVSGGLEVVVLEARDRPGGNIRTERIDGFTIEAGPNGFLDNAPATLEIVRRLRLESRLQRADDRAARRFLYRDGRLHLLPTGPLDFLRSSVLSVPGRLRVLLEPFARPRPPGVDETVFQFASRRIGSEAAAILVDAMVSGVFAGDVRRLSLRSSFPAMYRMEEEHGGLGRALVARMRDRRAAKQAAGDGPDRVAEAVEPARPGGPAGPGGTLTSFADGLDAWVEALAAELGPGLRTGSRAVGLARSPREDARPWIVSLEGAAGVAADAVVVAIPSPRAAPLLEPLDPTLGGAIAQIPTAGVAVVALGFRQADIAALDGFGFLVPRGTGPRILGCLWDSSIFPGRAPEGHVLVRAMIGGAHDPEALLDDDDALVDRVRHDLATTMRVDAEPVLTRVFRWPLGIGQYTVGHQERLDRIHGRLRGHPGVWLAGSSFYGVSMNACVERAAPAAKEIVAFLG